MDFETLQAEHANLITAMESLLADYVAIKRELAELKAANAQEEN